MRFKLPSFLAALVLCLNPVSGIPPEQADPLLEPWRWETFPQLEGPGFRAVAEDTDGNVWFATDTGVKRYDGLEWTDYTAHDGLHGTPVNILLAASDGRVYAGSRKGISVFEDGVWRRVFPADTNVDWTIWSVREMADGSIWSATARGALRISPDGEMVYFTTQDCVVGLRAIAPWMQYVVVPAELVTPAPWPNNIGIKTALGLPAFGGTITNSVIRALAPDGPAERAGARVGDQMLGPNGEEGPPNLDYDGPPGTTTTLYLRQLGQSEVRKVTIERARVSGEFRDFWLFDVYEDKSGTIWFATRTGELIAYNGSIDSPTYKRYDNTDGLDIHGRRPGTRLAETSEGSLWAVTADPQGGLNRFHNGIWQASRLEYTGGSDENQSVSIGPDGTLWVGGNGTLHAYRNGNWNVYRQPETPIPNGRVIVHADAKGGLWVGGIGRGISRVDMSQRHTVTRPDLAFQYADLETQWFLSQTGTVVSRSGAGWTSHPDLPMPAVAVVSLDGITTAVCATEQSATVYQLRNNRWIVIAATPISGEIQESSITVLNRTLWFGDQMAAFELKDDSFTKHHLNQPVYAITQTADGTFWVGARTNLYRSESDGFKRVRKPDALTRTLSQALVSTREGHLWVGTQFFGVFQHDGRVWRRFDTQDGLPDNNVTALHATPEGHIVAGTDKGYSRYDGRSWAPYLVELPPPRPRGLRKGIGNATWIVTKSGASVRYSPDTVSPITRLTIDVDRVSQPGNTVISWSGRDQWHGRTDQLMYSYRLDDEGWSEFSSTTSQTFLALSVGDHVLEVRARDDDFNVEPNPVRATFSVAPPVWQEPWLLVLFGILLVAGTGQTIRLVQRDRNLAKANEELELARTDLERRVKQRTRELSEAYDQLMTEVAERERAERELIHLERLRAVGEMSAGISHNLNNILTGILAPAQVVQESLTDPDQLFYLETVIRSAERATDLVSRLHKAVKGTQDEAFQPVSANKVILEAIQTARPRWKDEPEAQGLNIEVLTELHEVDRVKATESGLHDIIVNLIFNAVDAMPEGGTVTVGTEESEDNVVITVSDTGVGMDEDTRRRVFEPFFTTKMDVGTGLGLFTVHGTIRRWHATIDVDSTPDSGTTFSIEIPKWHAEQALLDEETQSSVQPRRSDILVIDDEPVVRDAVFASLSRDHAVTTVEDVQHALRQFTASNYDIIFIDLGMPGMPGDVLAGQLKESDPSVVTILITGWDLDDDDERMVHFDFALQKPLLKPDLENITARAIRLRDQRLRGGGAAQRA